MDGTRSVPGSACPRRAWERGAEERRGRGGRQGPSAEEPALLRFEGDRDFTRPPAAVWQRLTDARFLVRCIPDVDAVKEVSADRAVLILRPGFAFVRGTLEVSLEVTEKSAPTAGKILLTSKG